MFLPRCVFKSPFIFITRTCLAQAPSVTSIKTPPCLLGPLRGLFKLTVIGGTRCISTRHTEIKGLIPTHCKVREGTLKSLRVKRIGSAPGVFAILILQGKDLDIGIRGTWAWIPALYHCRLCDIGRATKPLCFHSLTAAFSISCITGKNIVSWDSFVNLTFQSQVL